MTKRVLTFVVDAEHDMADVNNFMAGLLALKVDFMFEAPLESEEAWERTGKDIGNQCYQHFMALKKAKEAEEDEDEHRIRVRQEALGNLTKYAD